MVLEGLIFLVIFEIGLGLFDFFFMLCGSLYFGDRIGYVGMGNGGIFVFGKN